MNAQQLELLCQLLNEAELLRMPIWLGGGWAIDARLGRITREHDDIDLTFPSDRSHEFVALIEGLGGSVSEETDYGFLASVNGVLLDCEPAHWNGIGYDIDDAPDGSCPDGLEGKLDGRPIRCNSWEAIIWDYFYYASEVPLSQWPAKHVHSFELVRKAIGEAAVARLNSLFVSRDAE